jgi:hypothetical protein
VQYVGINTVVFMEIIEVTKVFWMKSVSTISSWNSNGLCASSVNKITPEHGNPTLQVQGYIRGSHVLSFLRTHQIWTLQSGQSSVGIHTMQHSGSQSNISHGPVTTNPGLSKDQYPCLSHAVKHKHQTISGKSKMNYLSGIKMERAL